MTAQEAIARSIQEAREDGMRQAKITTNAKAVHMLMINLGIDLEDALKLLEIPRDERKTYRKICAARSRQKKSPEIG